MLTFLDTKQDDGIVSVAGCCANTSRFAYLVNASTRRLIRRGDFVGTLAPIHTCVRNGCVVWNRYVGAVRKIKSCNRNLDIGNLWYNFLDPHQCGNGFWNGAHDGPGVMFANGQSPAYSDIYGDGRLVRAYARCQQDYGKTIRIFGVDNGNQPLRTNNGDGTWSDGVVITLGSSGMNPNYGSTTTFVRRIDRVVKDVTQCQVLLYAYNATTDVLEDLAIYDPGETSPSYARYQLNVNRMNLGVMASCCGALNSVVALVKLRWIPVRFDTDLVIIDNLDALAYEVQCLRAQEAGDLQLAKGYEVAAVQELNRELEDAFPDDQFSASNEVFGGATFSNHCY